MRIKKPDFKDAQSLIEAARRDIGFTLGLKVTDESASTIIRNIYECFRMLGDALLTLKGIESIDHLQPIKELAALEIETGRPLASINILRRLRHNVNYYGYRASAEEAEEVVSLARSCFESAYKEIELVIKKGRGVK